ncbi:lysozyme inhibitor LprI family protein [Oceanobacillus massiliensis]|uniref:lysozyme inhibitor LprI family protein n=1 Tax=Oceanobacillus massiliensis TaxID=1465765 RepID=UPI003017BACC
MNNKRKIFTLILAAILVFLAACNNPSDETNANKQSQNNSSSENTGEDSTQTDTTEDSSDGTDMDEQNDQDSSDSKSSNSSDGESAESGNSESETTESKKEEYLKILNEMEESDRNAEAETTTSGMVEQEEERYKNWDEALNEIYGVLKEQLDAEQMDNLREEQRNWVEHRDEAAKEASLKYEGGSTESLEYIATQASLTKERCYELVANYMK